MQPKINTLNHMDCLKAMKMFPDKHFELAIVDPPYGNAGAPEWDKKKGGRFGADKNWANKIDGKVVSWDVAPDSEYFTELFRVSRNQIIWGGNYFNEHLPSNRNFIVWRKLSISENFTMAMAEYAWTSIKGNAKLFSYAPQSNSKEPRFHPTQKPVALYRWLLQKYAKPGDKILDTHVGSASSLIACIDMGFDYMGFEIDKDYYTAAQERIDAHLAQGCLWREPNRWD